MPPKKIPATPGKGKAPVAGPSEQKSGRGRPPTRQVPHEIFDDPSEDEEVDSPRRECSFIFSDLLLLIHAAETRSRASKAAPPAPASPLHISSISSRQSSAFPPITPVKAGKQPVDPFEGISVKKGNLGKGNEGDTSSPVKKTKEKAPPRDKAPAGAPNKIPCLPCIKSALAGLNKEWACLSCKTGGNRCWKCQTGSCEKL
jgi:hypothetical protein